MADIKPPSPVRVECRYTMCSSGDKANLECLQCYLVGYCSEECALKDRSQHSEFCERHRSRMNVEYDPKEDLDRFLSGPDEKSSLRPDERTSGRVLASRAGHPKLIATDATDSFSLGSIDRRLGARVSILTEGVGDLSLFIDNFLEMPPGQERQYVFQIKEAHETTVLRDMVILLMAFDGTNFIRTAEAMIHYWYSAYLPPWVFHFLQGSVVHYLDNLKQTAAMFSGKSGLDDIANIAFNCKQVDNFRLSVWLPKRVWKNSEHLKVFSSAFSPVDHAAVQSQRYQNIRNRRQEIEKELSDPSKPPEWRTSKVNFLETGVLLPISTSRHNHTRPNPSFFRQGKQCFDYGDDPLQAYEQFELAGSFNSAKNDRHGQLFFHVREKLVRFICKLKNFKGNVKIHLCTTEGAGAVETKDPDLRWPPVTTQPSDSAASPWPTGTNLEGEEKQTVGGDADSDTSSGLFVKDNLDSDFPSSPDGHGSLAAQTESLVETKLTNETAGNQTRRLTKGQKKKAALARKKAANANAVAQKAEHLAHPKQEAPASEANAKKSTPASGFQLESTETETTTSVSSRQEATGSAIDSNGDGEPKSMAENPQHTHSTCTTSHTAVCSSPTPAASLTPISTGTISAGGQTYRCIILYPNYQTTSPCNGPSLEPPASSDKRYESAVSPHEALGSEQPPVAIGDGQPPSSATPDSEPSTGRRSLPDQQPDSGTSCTASAMTTEAEKAAAGSHATKRRWVPLYGRSGQVNANRRAYEDFYVLETCSAINDTIDAIKKNAAEFDKRWTDCVKSGNANVETLHSLAADIHKALENDPRMPKDTWRLLWNRAELYQEREFAPYDIVRTSYGQELTRSWDKLIDVWETLRDSIGTVEYDLEEQVKKKKAKRNKQKKENMKKKKKTGQDNQDSNDQTGQISEGEEHVPQDNDTLEEATKTSEDSSSQKTTKAEDTAREPTETEGTPQQETEPHDGSKQPIKVKDTSRELTEAGGIPQQETDPRGGSEDTAQEPTETEGTPRQETEPRGGSKQPTKVKDAPQEPTEAGGIPQQETNPHDGSKQHIKVKDTSRELSEAGGTPKQETEPRGGSKQPTKVKDAGQEPTKVKDTAQQVTQHSSKSWKHYKKWKAAKKGSQAGKSSETMSRGSETVAHPTDTSEHGKKVSQGSGNAEEASRARDELEQECRQSRAFTTIGGKEVEITGREIDPAVLAALPEDIREKALASSLGPELEAEGDWTPVQRKKVTGKGKEKVTHRWRGPATRTTQDKESPAQQNEAKDSGQGKEPWGGTKRMETKAPDQNPWNVVASYKSSQPPQAFSWKSPRKTQKIPAWRNSPKPPQKTKGQETVSESVSKPLQVAASDKRGRSPAAIAPDDAPDPPQVAVPGKLPPSQVTASTRSPPPVTASTEPADLPEAVATAKSPPPQVTASTRSPPPVTASTEPADLPEAVATVKPSPPQVTASIRYPLAFAFDEPADLPEAAATAKLSASQVAASDKRADSPPAIASNEPPEAWRKAESFYWSPSQLAALGKRPSSDPGGISYALSEPDEPSPPDDPEQSQSWEQPGRLTALEKGKSVASRDDFLTQQDPRWANEMLQTSQAILHKMRESRNDMRETLHIVQTIQRQGSMEPWEQPGTAMQYAPWQQPGTAMQYAPWEQPGTAMQYAPWQQPGTAMQYAHHEPEHPWVHDPGRGQVVVEQDVPGRNLAVRVLGETAGPSSVTRNRQDDNVEATTQTEATTQAGFPFARNIARALQQIHPTVPDEGFPIREKWGILAHTYAVGITYAFQVANKVNPRFSPVGTSAPITTGAAIKPGATLEDLMDYEKSHFVTRAEEVGDVPVRPIPWEWADWQEHMEQLMGVHS